MEDSRWERGVSADREVARWMRFDCSGGTSIANVYRPDFKDRTLTFA